MTGTESKRNIDKIKRKATKSVHFADDHGYLLVKNFNIPKTTTCKGQPPVKLSKVTNFTECTKENNDIYLESTITNKSAVFGTLVVTNDLVEPSDLKIAYCWDKKTSYRISLPYYVGSRLIFKLPVPKRLKGMSTDENNALNVSFYVTHQDKRLTQLNNGNEYTVTWTER